MFKPRPLPEPTARSLNQRQRDKIARRLYELLVEELESEECRIEGWEVHYVGPEGLLIYLPERTKYGDPMTHVQVNLKIPW